ncbi:Ig-like domain-containing protein [Segatella salivae]|uniref:Ig-like domain-containing protein n=1 Tax=Segatella salivae TaxID=228604 RepID=UPI0028D27C01|nr:Ig-like domain-containing protein [Segatella salivae]
MKENKSAMWKYIKKIKLFTNRLQLGYPGLTKEKRSQNTAPVSPSLWVLPSLKGIGGGLSLLLTVIIGGVFTSCARMGNPDGGWYDETPPKVLGATPADKATEVKAQKVKISFDEFVKIDNPTENVIVSPPQLQAPEIKATGKSIEVKLLDSLKANTTYTIDFSDAISDNNEGNPLGNYTYSFSTGAEIDTMEVSGYVVAAENLEPVKGILVGLYANLADSAFEKQPMLRVSRTDSRGHFVIKGVKRGTYRVYALQDVDGNYQFNQKSEMIAFNHELIKPSVMDDTRQDTLWSDSLHIADIKRVGYAHFLPDNITLCAFHEVLTSRYLLSVTRNEANHFAVNFSYGNPKLPQIKGLNFNAHDAFIAIPNAKRDTIDYWLRDTALVNQDTLRMEMTYLMTDSAGQLVSQTDTLEVLSKQPYERRMKQLKATYEKWQKQQEKLKKKGEPYQTEMPRPTLAIRMQNANEIDPEKRLQLQFETPISTIDTTKVHLYTKVDSLWYRANYQLLPAARRNAEGHFVRPDSLKYGMNYEISADWKPGQDYSFETDSTAFTDIYGAVTPKYKQGFKVKGDDEFGSLVITLTGLDGQPCIVQLLDRNDKVIKEVAAEHQQAEFYYLKPETYYLRLFVDSNHNGIWDTGDYAKDRQPEAVYYYPGKIECKAKWDLTESWNPTSTPLYQQKPGAITKQKADKQKTIRRRNAERAKQMGLPYTPETNPR